MWKPTGTGGDRNASRKIGENKLLSSKNRYVPYTPGGSKGAKGAASAGATFDKCITCKATCARAGAKYCIRTLLPPATLPITDGSTGCAYKGGQCAMCGVQILGSSNFSSLPSGPRDQVQG